MDPLAVQPEVKTDVSDEYWSPRLSPKQLEAFNDMHRYQLWTGPRKCGKSWAACHKGVRHLWETPNANLLIITTTADSAINGIWDMFVNFVIPEWVENVEGFSCTEPKFNGLTKLPEMYITNMHGGRSHVFCRSFQYEEEVRKKIKSNMFSMVIIDELADFEGPSKEEMNPKDEKTPSKYPAFFTDINFQLDRRPGCPLPLYIALTNPDPVLGTDHWVYQWFLDEERIEKRDTRERTRYSTHWFTIDDNPFLTFDQKEDLRALCSSSKELYQCWWEGKWIRVDTASNLFPWFNKEVHVRGDEDTYLAPDPEESDCFVGYDLGQINHGVIFLQKMRDPIKSDQSVWAVFDEIVLEGVQLKFQDLVEGIIEKMDKWDNDAGKKFNWRHISDTTAFDNWNPHTGSFDITLIQNLSQGRIKLERSPKPKNSVRQRVNMINNLLQRHRFYVGNNCTWTIRTLSPGGLRWDAKAQKGGLDKFDRTGPYIHDFDALTYPIFRIDSWDYQFGGPRTKQKFSFTYT